MNIVYFGTAEFGLPALEGLRAAGHSIVAVVSTPAKPSGRGLKLTDSPVSRAAADMGLTPVFTPDSLKSPEFIETLKSLNADLFVVIAFRILPQEVFSIPRFGTVNVHAALLPAFRGPAPIHRAIEAGASESGVTVFRIDTGVDTGNILLQKRVTIGSNETTPELYERLSLLSKEALVEAVAQMENGSAIYTKQDESAATRAPKLHKNESLLDFSLSAQDLFNKIKAFKPFPGTAVMLKGKRLEIEWALPVTGDFEAVDEGEICGIEKGRLIVKCKDSFLEILQVKPEGKKSVAVQPFLNGARLNNGEKLC